MEKLTLKQVEELISKHNKEKGIKQQYSDKEPLRFVGVFKQENFNKEYTIEERSYQFRSDEKYFLPEMGGSSWYDHCIADDDTVRLDWYHWTAEYYYQIES